MYILYVIDADEQYVLLRIFACNDFALYGIDKEIDAPCVFCC